MRLSSSRTKIETVPTDSMGHGNEASAPNSSVDTAEYSVADIFAFVKENNDRFEADSDHPTKFAPKDVTPARWNIGSSQSPRQSGGQACETIYRRQKYLAP